MRKLTFLFFLILAACGGNDPSVLAVLAPTSSTPSTPPAADAHAPRILNLELSQSSALYMEGDGQVAVTAVLEVEDEGLDIETLRVSMPNDVVVNLDVSGLVDEATGTITQEFNVATTEVGYVEIWFALIDAAGGSSLAGGPDFYLVKGDPFTWIERATDVPNALNDITRMAIPGAGMFYVDTKYIAVGDAGTIMTSWDGIEWTMQESGTDVDLNAVSCGFFFFGCIAVGDDGTILLSDDNFQSEWTVYYDGPDDVSLQAIYLDLAGGLTLVGGTIETTDTACILHESTMLGEEWTAIEPTLQSGFHITSIRPVEIDDGEFHFVAALEVPSTEQGRILLSADGLTWVEVFISDGHESTFALERDDIVWAGGSAGRIYSSPDGVNWTQYETPAIQSNLVAMIAEDSVLMAHGFDPSIGMGQQVGVATSDGGETWQSFVIGAAYEPRGLAYGEGRWVSVGRSLAEAGKGAIFTTQ
jgi:hypothetical protein